MDNKISRQIAKHLREVHFGGNWTWSNYKQLLSDVDYRKATEKIDDLNNIATLIAHATYYVKVQWQVLGGAVLVAKDELSFLHPPIHSQSDWEQWLEEIWSNAESLAKAIEQLPDSRLTEMFVAEKYGTYYRNLNGMIEHLHYHLGQIAILKKMLMKSKE